MKQNIYDHPEFFAGYRELRRTESGLNAVLEQPALHALLPALAGRRVLDIGCGFGHFCRHARAAGAARVLGIDISARMLEAARAQTADPAIAYRHQAMEDLALEADAWDVVVSSLAFHYVRDFAAVIATVARGLAPGGSLVFSIEHPICTALLADWHSAPDGRRLHWPVDRYREEGERVSHWFVDGVVKYHRTLETTLNTLLDAGLALRRCLEPEATAAAVARRPELAEQRRRPPFLVVRADKPAA